MLDPVIVILGLGTALAVIGSVCGTTSASESTGGWANVTAFGNVVFVIIVVLYNTIVV